MALHSSTGTFDREYGAHFAGEDCARRPASPRLVVRRMAAFMKSSLSAYTAVTRGGRYFGGFSGHGLCA